MRKVLCCAAALVALNLALLSDVSQGQVKPGQKKTTVQTQDATPQDYAALVQAKEIIGTITYVDVGTNTLTIRVELQQMVPNTNTANNKNLNAQQQALLRSQQQIMRDYQNIMNSRNPLQQQQRLQKLMMDYQNLQMRMAQSGMNTNQYKTVTVVKEFDIDLAPGEGLRVARAKLPEEYDDKGNIVKYTEEELKKLRDPVLGGFLAKPADLLPGQKVNLYVSPRPKANKTDPKKNKTDPKKVDEDAKKTEPGDEPLTPKTTGKTGDTTTGKIGGDAQSPPHPYVRSIMIVAEPDPAAQPKNDKKKKKKNNN
jgi:hypothetical protein